MDQKEFEIIVSKAIENAPEWLLTDIEKITEKENHFVRISFVISQLYQQYTSMLTHVFSSMSNDTEWYTISYERLNFIDNNLDLIGYILHKIQSNK